MEKTYLKIRKDLVEDGLSVPIWFLDTREHEWLEDSDALNIECLDQVEELAGGGYNTIVEVTNKLGAKRWGYVSSIDFDYYD